MATKAEMPLNISLIQFHWIFEPRIWTFLRVGLIGFIGKVPDCSVDWHLGSLRLSLLQTRHWIRKSLPSRSIQRIPCCDSQTSPNKHNACVSFIVFSRENTRIIQLREAWLLHVTWRFLTLIMDTTPTQPHRNKKTQSMWWYNRKVAGSWWWMY